MRGANCAGLPGDGLACALPDAGVEAPELFLLLFGLVPPPSTETIREEPAVAPAPALAPAPLRDGVVLLRRIPVAPLLPIPAPVPISSAPMPLLRDRRLLARLVGPLSTLPVPSSFAPRFARPGDFFGVDVRLRPRRAPPPSCTWNSPTSSSESEGSSTFSFVKGRETAVNCSGVMLDGGGGERPSTK